MNNAIFKFAMPENEPVLNYAKGSKERELLEDAIKKMSNEKIEIPLIIGGKEIKTGDKEKVVIPHNHTHVLAEYHKAGEKEVHMAVEAAVEAQKTWSAMSWVERASITMKVAELLATKYRYLINAATMLGQSKTPFQAEIDSACETIDFLRFNAYYMSQIYSDQPISPNGTINRMEYRPLEGFVFALSPFNFTSIAANLSMSPVLMGNAVVWKPSSTAVFSNYMLMKIFMEAGLPAGVINFIPGKGSVVGNVVLKHKSLAGIHFTGSTGTFNHLWKTVSNNLENFHTYPKIVGETGGKDFVFVHPSANVDQTATALIRGAFEFQGQKCSAASRAYIPESLWKPIKDKMFEMFGRLKMGDSADFSTFMNAVIDENAFDSIMSYIEKAKTSEDAEIVYGGNGDKSKGYFIEPTVIQAKNPTFVTMVEEIFGPVLSVYIYKDDEYEKTLKLCDESATYALTGAIFAQERQALIKAYEVLKYSAGNFYFNDKPTGAVVGQQPFGGARASGTNDKAGSYLNLIRWTSPRTIKENLIAPTDFVYPYMK